MDMFKIKDVLPPEVEEVKEYVLKDSDTASDEMKRLLERCRYNWEHLYDVRKERKNNRQYYVGEQWQDSVQDPDNPGQYITEEDLIIRQGRQPMKNNQIQQIVKNILGQYRDNDYKPLVLSRKKEQASTTEMMTNALQFVYKNEELNELDCRVFEDYLIGAVPIWKVEFGWNSELKTDSVQVYKVNINRLGFNVDLEDIRMKDLDLIFEIIDTPFENILGIFGKGDPKKEKVIKRWYHKDDEYNRSRNDDSSTSMFGPDELDAVDFYNSAFGSNKDRMFEVWRKEKKTVVKYHDFLTGEDGVHQLPVNEAIEYIVLQNQERILEFQAMGVDQEEVPLIDYDTQVDDVWHYYYLTPSGHVLAMGETPYDHESHPYIIRPYPMLDKKVIPFVSTVKDQQKYINRLITMIDFMIGAGAKGVLLIPEDSIPKGKSPQDFADEYVKFNGVIVYKPNQRGELPKQIYANSQSSAGQQMLALQLQLLKEISGVTEAIQGQRPTAGTPASLYAQMSNNATISSKDYFQHFFSARAKRDLKIIQVIQQFWDSERYINVSGQDYENEAYIYNPDKARDGVYDIVIGKSGNSPIFRQMIDEYLFKFLDARQIDLKMFLENTSLPFADKLLQQINEKEESQMAQMQAMANSPEANQFIQQQQNANPQLQGLFEQALGKN